MGSAAMGPVISTYARWIRAESGTWHAYTMEWQPGAREPSKVMPQCGALLPRDRMGRKIAPPTGEEVCPRCAHMVGFRRRPAQSAYMARKHGLVRVPNVGGIMGRVLMLEQRVNALERARGEL